MRLISDSPPYPAGDGTIRAMIFEHPQQIMGFLDEAGLLVRNWETDWRGPIAFMGENRVWGIGYLTDVLPVKGSAMVDDTENPEKKKRVMVNSGGYMWKMAGFELLPEPLPVSRYTNDIWESPRGLEPIGLQAAVAAKIEHLFWRTSEVQTQPTVSSEAAIASEVEAALDAPVEATPEPYDGPPLALSGDPLFEGTEKDKRGQFAMFV